MYEVKNCIDAGSEYCPCHLAKTGECIICSQLSGKSFCDCKNWKGTCILQEYHRNGNKPKSQRRTYNGTVIEKVYEDNGILKLKIKSSISLIKGLKRLGSFVFLRSESSQEFYDCPISILKVDEEEEVIVVAIEIRGIKTKTIEGINEKDNILIRGPFWNGIFGVKKLSELSNDKVIVLGRGIGIAPLIPVLKDLLRRNNKVFLILDSGDFKKDIFDGELSFFQGERVPMKIFDNGELSKELNECLLNLINTQGYSHIHISGPDILAYKVTKEYKNSLTLSCSNNAKMCCGEGVCGSCSSRYSGHIVRRLCKVQCEPNSLFEGRRLI